ncbi:hypothetical protein MA9V2_018 [Chryseobacterium phage MA9V-2]|nr:hypothetical protein MA9V2_018 [Chryseobacterium phage MA9V-2]
MTTLILTNNDKLILKAIKPEYCVSSAGEAKHRNVANGYFIDAILAERFEEARQYLHLLTKDFREVIVTKFPNLLDI